MEETTINKRVAQVIEALDISQNAFAKALSMSSSRVSNVVTGRNKPDSEFLAAMVTVFTNVSATWLLTGNGQLFIDPKAEISEAVESAIERAFPNNLVGTTQNAQPNAQVNAQVNGHDKFNHVHDVVHLDLLKPAPIVITLDSRGQENIVMVDTRAAAGYPVHFLEPEFYRELPVFSLPGSAFRNATFRCFQVRGNSMVPTFNHEDWVISRYVDNWPQNIKNGYVYVVVTTEQVFIKRVLNRVMERNTLVLQSDNEEYDTQEVNALDVLELWYVKARLSFKFPNTRFEVHRKVGEMQADIQYLLGEVKALKNGNKKAD